jgi:hypothetical protein
MPAQKLRTYDFSADTTDPESFGDLISDLQTYGLPFMADAASLPRTRELLMTGRFGYPVESAYRIPVAYYVEGDITNCRKALDVAVAKWGTGSHAAAAAFRQFAERLAERIGH